MTLTVSLDRAVDDFNAVVLLEKQNIKNLSKDLDKMHRDAFWR